MGNTHSKVEGPLYSRLQVSRVEDCLLFDYVDLASDLYGSSIVTTSDQFFSSAENLLKPNPPKKIEDEYGGELQLSCFRLKNMHAVPVQVFISAIKIFLPR